MNDLIIKNKNKQGEEVFTINSKKKLIEAPSYNISLAVCEDPTCDCGKAIVHIKEENKNVFQSEYSIPINIHKKVVNPSEYEDAIPEGEAEELIKFFNGFTKTDWSRLKGMYQFQKAELIDEIDPKEINYIFSEEEYREVGMMFPYKLIFPCSQFYIFEEERFYFIYERYCKNPGCECTDICIDVCELQQGDLPIRDLGRYVYDYESQEGKIDSGEDPTLTKKIVEQLFEKYPNLNEKFKRRSANLKVIYEQSKKQYFTLNSFFNEKIKPVGRNAPCPCGSGKKYKRCCLKKAKSL